MKKKRIVTILIFGIFLFSLAYLSAATPYATYAFNNNYGIYNSTFLEDISGNGHNITGNFYGNITELGNEYLIYNSNYSTSSPGFDVFTNYNSSSTILTLDFYVKSPTDNDLYLWQFDSGQAYNNNGTQIYYGSISITLSETELGFGFYGGLGFQTINFTQERTYDRIAIKVNKTNISVFQNGEYIGEMDQSEINANVDYYFLPSISILSGRYITGSWDTYSIGEINLYNESTTNEELIAITSENLLSSNTIAYATYSFNNDYGIYNSTFIEDISGNGHNATGNFYGNITEIYNGYLEYLRNATNPTGFSTGLSNINTSSTDLVFDFYENSLTENNPWYYRINSYGYNYNGTLMLSGSPIAIYRDGDYLYFGFYTGFGYKRIYLPLNKTYDHLAIRINNLDISVFRNGVYEGDMIDVSFNSNVNYIILEEISLFTGSYGAFSPVFIGETNFYTNYINNYDLITITNESVLNPSLNFTYPIYNNIVIQRDKETNTANLTLEFSNDESVEKMNLTMNNENLIEINITNPFIQTYTFENLSIGCYNFTINSNQDEKVLTNYCIGDVFIVMGQSNSNRGGEYFNWTKVNYTLESNNVVSALSTSSYPLYRPYYVEHYDKLFDIYNTNSWVSGIWAPLAYGISNLENVPVMIFNTGVTSSSIECFLDGGDCYDSTTKNNQIAFKYSNDAAFIIWMQGEGDRGDTNYKEYLYNLTNNWNEWYNFEYEEPYLLVPIGDYDSGETDPCSPTSSYSWPQWANYNLSLENSSYFIPANIYDLATTSTYNCVHIVDVEVAAYQFAMRVYNGTLYHIYNYSSIDRPKIEKTFIYNSTTIGIKYDRTIKIEDGMGNSGDIAYGLRLFNSTDGNWYDAGQINNTNLISSSIINDVYLLQIFNSDISSSIEYSMCAYGIDCYNKTIIRSNTSNYPIADPSIKIYRETIEDISESDCESLGNYWYDNGCHNTESTYSETTHSSGGSSGMSFTSLGNIKNGFNGVLKRGSPAKFDIKGEIHKLYLTEINKNKGTASFLFYSAPIYITLNIGETKDIDLDSDGIYDVTLIFNSFDDSSYAANIELKEYDVQEVVALNNNEEEKETPQTTSTPEVESSNSIFYWIVSIIALLIIAGITYYILKYKK